MGSFVDILNVSMIAGMAGFMIGTILTQDPVSSTWIGAVSGVVTGIAISWFRKRR